MQLTNLNGLFDTTIKVSIIFKVIFLEGASRRHYYWQKVIAEPQGVLLTFGRIRLPVVAARGQYH